MARAPELPGQVGMDEVIDELIPFTPVDPASVFVQEMEAVPDLYLRPLPDSPLQKTAFPVFERRPLSVTFTVSLSRVSKPRKCASCGLRRILYEIGISDMVTGSPLCAHCAGIR